jgi:hypothetical protein
MIGPVDADPECRRRIGDLDYPDEMMYFRFSQPPGPAEEHAA